MYILNIIKKYGLNAEKYISKASADITGKISKIVYIKINEVFSHLWLNTKISKKHYSYIQSKYSLLNEVEVCIKEFHRIYEKKNMPLLYIFIENIKIFILRSYLHLQKDLKKIFVMWKIPY